MKQVVRRVIDRKGRVRVIDLPEPHVGPEQVLVQNAYSLISSGTELGTIAKTPAELVRQTITDPWMRHVVRQTVLATGPGQTARRVWQEMTMPREIGYSAAGRILAFGENVEGLQLGQGVAYAATGHAELVAPHLNHIVPVPDAVELSHAAFVTVGGIVIQALRRAEIQFGETIAVYGLGLLGQVCARVAKAAGCVVVGIDIDEQRNELAKSAGMELVANPSKTDIKRQIMDFTQKHGVDATIICASTDSDTVINTAMEITRRQGRVVVVGYVKLNIHPKEFLYREIDLRYSRAYGPGSYHTGYEKGRVDYPFGYVRWTEKRNLQEFVRLLHTGAVDLRPLIGETYTVDRAQEAFDAVRTGTLPGVAAVIAYDTGTKPDRRKTLEVKVRPKRKDKVGISVIGCGNHVLGKHLPNLRKHPDVEVRGLASATGKNASMIAESVGATIITTDVQELLDDQDTDAVLVCSSQPEHLGHIRQAIQAGKAIYVEKPMVTLCSDFREVVKLMEQQPVLLTLGLNRRYSPLVTRLRESIEGPVDSVQYLITQPYVPPDHWTLDEVEGGGRLITEGEHFIDLCHLLIGRPPITVSARALGKTPDDIRNLCNFAVTIEYEEGVATVVFNESGAAGFPREQVTVLARGQVAVLDDFARLTVHGRKRRAYGSLRRKEMGHKEALREFVAAIRGQPNRMLTWEEASLATICMFAAQESIQSGGPVDLREFGLRLPEKVSA
jgi:predicted dehydrogenase/threonine dehydrogenase-like Zn-dependent dehydrogenase